MKKKDKQGWMLIAGVAACMVSIFGVRAYLEGQPKPDLETNCVGRPTHNTVILIDRSDALAKQTEDEIMARTLRHIADDVQINERVSIFTVSDLSKKNLSSAFSKCKPPSERNQLTEGISVERAFVENFQKPIVAAIAKFGNASGESPIAQAITDLTLKDEMNGETNSLLIFSDMLENTPKFKLYGCTSGKKAIANYIASTAGRTERPSLKSTTVVLNIIPRDSKSTTSTCRNEFWTWFFEDVSGPGSYLRINPLPG